MSYKHRDPVPTEEMDVDKYEGHHSLCQFLRDIYHLAGGTGSNLPVDLEQLKVKARTAMAMAKAMNDKLQYFKHLEEEQQGKLPPGTAKRPRDLWH